MNIRPFKGVHPNISQKAMVDETAVIIGDVTLADYVSIWPHAVLRGDLAPISVGESSNIQENVTVHVNENQPVIIGKNVTIGHNAVLHGCVIDDDVLIGMGAILLDGSHIERDTVIGAGALVSQTKRILEGNLMVGMPVKALRTLTDDEKSGITRSAQEYVHLAKELYKE